MSFRSAAEPTAQLHSSVYTTRAKRAVARLQGPERDLPSRPCGAVIRHHSAHRPGASVSPPTGFCSRSTVHRALGGSNLLQTRGPGRIRGPRLRGSENRDLVVDVEEGV